MAYIALFICGWFAELLPNCISNASHAGNVVSLKDAPSMSNVLSENWRINIYYFFILFAFFQFSLNLALRRSGGSDEDLGLFGIWKHRSNSNGGGGIDSTLTGNSAVVRPNNIQETTVSPPAYMDPNVDRDVSSRKNFLDR